MKPFSASDRTEELQKLKGQSFDLIVVGGGITGAGVARDAAQRGMKVVLLEQNDFASGTSSRSSKLIHGGIRYLENLDFKLVFEALSERRNLFTMAPHLVHPLRFLIPLYKKGRVGMFKMGLGMWFYDALSLFEAPEMHEHLNTMEAIGRIPSLQPNELMGAYEYSDAYMDDDRLVHETLRSANHYGAHCFNYLQVQSFLYDKSGKANGVIAKDKISNSEIQFSAEHIVSCLGPWTDQFANEKIKSWKTVLRPTKGVHITFSRDRLPLSRAVVMAAEKRIVFAIPRHEMAIIGTTDTDFRSSPDSVGADVSDIDYLLKVTADYFPGAKITKSDIIASYAGVRPLINDGADSEGKTSREHLIYQHDNKIIFVAGGKYTTYRLMAEQVVEKVLSNMTLEDRYKFSFSKSKEPLNPLATEEIMNQRSRIISELSQYKNLSEYENQKLADRFGQEALEIRNRYPTNWNYFQIEAAHAIEHTRCMNILDFYARRAPLILSLADHGISQFQSVFEVFKTLLSESKFSESEQKKLLQDHISRELHWKFADAHH
jgi:glycerol-3-phosphate dehydrogenase